ncbi:hypothetical protein Zmor_005442 [Zophobas morio]|uniref:Uncharacterized protein n=1 Tax=Zophobas morio TaxID=2755281 RepID=A0AA38IPY4_9CUCU|nr:hypothetical protein Zmor_005442 [Zophobas morio]
MNSHNILCRKDYNKSSNECLKTGRINCTNPHPNGAIVNIGLNSGGTKRLVTNIKLRSRTRINFLSIDKHTSSLAASSVTIPSCQFRLQVDQFVIKKMIGMGTFKAHLLRDSIIFEAGRVTRVIVPFPKDKSEDL